MLREQGLLNGPVDHDVPVLSVRAGDKLKAVLFGYACHATVLDIYQWTGDHPGFAMLAVEEQHPGTQAMFWAGCGADQNPLPRRTVELAQKYGSQLAHAVADVLDGAMRPISGDLKTAYAEIDIGFAHDPDARTVAADARVREPLRARPRRHAAQASWKPTAASRPTYPYPDADRGSSATARCGSRSAAKSSSTTPCV